MVILAQSLLGVTVGGAMTPAWFVLALLTGRLVELGRTAPKKTFLAPTLDGPWRRGCAYPYPESCIYSLCASMLVAV